MQKEKFAKEWDWKQVEDEQIWLEPSPRSIYLLNRWKKLNKETFLDLGCGLGRHSLLFASNGFNVKAMDLSEESVRRVKELFKEKGLNIDVKQGDMHHIPFEDKSIDCLLAYHVLTHTNLEGIKIISSELYRILSK
ncbi:MAG: class I SAM-dependent methyltransferase, partial [Bacilli bacterium]|nr:class I SAM-dependent methyltransferase [Bacilli bacterium]